MIMDTLGTFAIDMDVSNAAGVTNFTDIIDLGASGAIEAGQPIYLVLVCTGGDNGIITAGSAGRIRFQLVSDATVSINASDPTTATSHLATPDYITDDAALNEVKKGQVFFVGALPPGGIDDGTGVHSYERYLGVQSVVATTTTTEGTVSAFLTLDPHGWVSKPDATN